MNRVDNASEPSMEEILATVRQIIADEPDRPASVFPAVEPNPLVPQSFAASDKERPAEPPEPPSASDRLSGVLKGGTLPATSPLGSKRPMSFDQDLADMFEEGGSAQGAAAAPKPTARAPEFSSAPKPESVSPSLSAEASLPPQLAPPAPSVPPPFGGSSAAAPVPPTRTFGFPPLRKQSFYPPQPPATPTLPPLPAKEAASGAQEKPVVDGAGLDEALKRLSNLGAIVPGESAPSAPMPPPSFGAPRLGEPFTAPTPSVSAPEPSLRASEPVAAPVAPLPSTPFFSAKPERSDAPKPTAPAAPASAAPFVAEKPFAEPAALKPTLSAASAPEPTPSATQALDALALGLAASAANAAAVPLTPVIEPHAAPRPSATGSASAAPAPAATAPARTLEDVVADMIRPMLQQWVADNMPRIIERALRVEVGKTGGPGQKPPGA